MSVERIKHLCRNSLDGTLKVGDVLEALATPEHPDLPIVSQLLLNDFKALEHAKSITSYVRIEEGQIVPMSLRAWRELPGQIVRAFDDTGWYKWYTKDSWICEPLYLSDTWLRCLCNLEDAKWRYYCE